METINKPTGTISLKIKSVKTPKTTVTVTLLAERPTLASFGARTLSKKIEKIFNLESYLASNFL